LLFVVHLRRRRKRSGDLLFICVTVLGRGHWQRFVVPNESFRVWRSSLDLSENQLSGTIPTMAYLTALG
jgi:hypothetical protein